MPPEASTAFDIQRRYEIPKAYLNFNATNHIAVRVYDYYNDGGIVAGPIGLYKVAKDPLLEVNLTGFWFFETEEEMDLRKEKKEKHITTKIFVPGYWENNGYRNYNGKATYSTRFKLPENLVNQDLFLILGFIDDIDHVYLNGEKIGSVNTLKKTEKSNLPYHKIFRGYAIPNGLLKENAYNSVSVLIYDKGGAGGIYSGPIGIANKENHEILKQKNLIERSLFEIFLDSFGF
jgi:sialate O-acetylesterase